MKPWARKPERWWLLAWALGALLAATVLAQWRLGTLREAFDLDARIAHRLLSQRLAQHDAVLVTLTLYSAPADAAAADATLRQLYPQFLQVLRQPSEGLWPAAQWASAEARSRQTAQAQVLPLPASPGRYGLLRAGPQGTVALLIELSAAVPWAEWPLPRDTSPVQVTVWQGGQAWLLQPGQGGQGAWAFEVRKPLASESQAFGLQLQRQVGWAELPWAAMLAAALAWGGLLALWRTWRRQREQKSRAEELLRLGQVSRLNALGELAAGLAHELNQPLTAIVANTQAARRLLDEGEAEEDASAARQAMSQAVDQAHRAADVVARLRRTVARPEASDRMALDVAQAVQRTLHLLAPELARAEVQVQPDLPALQALAEPVALEQVIHNLLMNAVQALAQVPVPERRLDIQLHAEGPWAVLRIADSGPGFSEDTRRRLFEPFFSTKPEGMGLGLSLCETLLTRLDGRIEASHHAPRGAVFTIHLPLAPA
ncbi:sensor histidine kinase [Ideonella paludis]|uniref:histidine kinase n=1 Tax=Ideonella paludis TaxID=1233411 RepID=A0ABS5DXZ4_9BURK|nr:ATP-binding protein [Ideonella paludis]MBQ0936020.1 two-component sensor histidine kinase [Ideonella paludis]